MQDRFADGLARNRAGVDRRTADHFQLFNERGALAEFRRLNRGSLASRPGTDHDEIVLFHGLPREYITVANVESLLTRACRSAIILKIWLRCSSGENDRLAGIHFGVRQLRQHHVA